MPSWEKPNQRGAAGPSTYYSLSNLPDHSSRNSPKPSSHQERTKKTSAQVDQVVWFRARPNAWFVNTIKAAPKASIMEGHNQRQSNLHRAPQPYFQRIQRNATTIASLKLSLEYCQLCDRNRTRETKTECQPKKVAFVRSDHAANKMQPTAKAP